MYTDAQLTEGWLVLNKRDETGAVINDLELRLSLYESVEEALRCEGYELASEWLNGYADIWPL